MTIVQYEKAMAELRAAVTSLTEENTLLRDFAYNVDASALTIHSRTFKNQ